MSKTFFKTRRVEKVKLTKKNSRSRDTARHLSLTAVTLGGRRNRYANYVQKILRNFRLMYCGQKNVKLQSRYKNGCGCKICYQNTLSTQAKLFENGLLASLGLTSRNSRSSYLSQHCDSHEPANCFPGCKTEFSSKYERSAGRNLRGTPNDTPL